MVLEQDYIIRMVRQLTAVLTRVLGLRRAGEDGEALDVIADAYGRLSGVSPSLVHALSEEDLIELLRARGSLDLRRCLTLAELLREEANVYEDQGKAEESYPRYLKSLRLFLEIQPDLAGAGLSVETTGLPEVLTHLEAYELPPSVTGRLLAYHEAAGRFDQAEDLLWETIAEDEATPDLVEEGRAFYGRLLGKSDDELAAGGLPREEVEEGLARLAEVEEGPQSDVMA